MLSLTKYLLKLENCNKHFSFLFIVVHCYFLELSLINVNVRGFLLSITWCVVLNRKAKTRKTSGV